MQSAFAQMQSAFAMCWFFPSRKIPNYFQNSDHQYRMSFALKNLFVSFLNMAMRSKQNMRHLFNGSQHSSAWWIQDAHNPFQICTVTNLRCAPLSCTKRGDLVREPHNSGRNRCDATCWLDHCGDQAHSVQRQAAAMRMMHSHHANDSKAVLIISNNFYFIWKNY